MSRPHYNTFKWLSNPNRLTDLYDIKTVFRLLILSFHLTSFHMCNNNIFKLTGIPTPTPLVNPLRAAYCFNVLGRHDAWMQPRLVTSQYCIRTSCWPFGSVSVPQELLSRATTMHHDDQWHIALMQYAVLKGWWAWASGIMDAFHIAPVPALHTHSGRDLRSRKREIRDMYFTYKGLFLSGKLSGFWNKGLFFFRKICGFRRCIFLAHTSLVGGNRP